MCVQVGYSQSALSVICGNEFSDDEHCGTYLEVHQQNGSPYTDETEVINDVQIDYINTSGYNTTTLSMLFGRNTTLQGTRENPTKILCNYQETVIRVGSMVLIKVSALEC